jgi:hypothetical protein
MLIPAAKKPMYRQLQGKVRKSGYGVQRQPEHLAEGYLVSPA